MKTIDKIRSELEERIENFNDEIRDGIDAMLDEYSENFIQAVEGEEYKTIRLLLNKVIERDKSRLSEYESEVFDRMSHLVETLAEREARE